MDDEGEISAQCWICPDCHEDHAQSALCSPKRDAPFMPAPDDRSYIAIKYREQSKRIFALEAALKMVLDRFDQVDAKGVASFTREEGRRALDRVSDISDPPTKP